MSTPVITHPEKVLFPDDGITKGELAAYYEAVAPVMVPHIRARPITMERYHRGIAAPGFFQKDVSRGFPEWIQRVEVPKKDGTVHHPIVTDTRSLLWLANQNCITPHVWTSRAPDLYHPDICVFDLDPSEERADILRKTALDLRDLLDELGLPSWVKTSGSKGFHIVAPLDGKAHMGEVSGFAHAVGRLLVQRDPENLTHMKHIADKLFGDQYQWSVLGAGRNQMYIATQSAVMGGNVRVGLEDSLWIGKGQFAKSNADQVSKIRRILEELGLEVATPDDARRILKLKGKNNVNF